MRMKVSMAAATVGIAVLALMAMAGAGGLVGKAHAANTTVVVKPSSFNGACQTVAVPVACGVQYPTGWLFYNDETDQGDPSLGSFVAGPGVPLSGTGSAQISVTGTQRRNLATYAFADTPLASITDLSFTTYNPSAGNGGSASRSGYLQFNVDFNGTDTWQRRLVFVPSVNGSVTQNTWKTWDAIDGGTALWLYSGATWPGGAIPGTTAKTWAQILADYPGIRIRVTDAQLSIRVGEPYADGYTENIDSFTFGTASGVTTFDFEPETPCTTTCYVNGTTGNDAFGGDTAATAKKTIQAAVTQVSAGGTVHVAAGTYDEDVSIGKALQLLGAGAGSTTISGPIGGGGATVQVGAGGVLVDGFTITRAGNNTTDWNGALNTAGVAIQGQGNNAEIRNNVLTGNRTGIDINNSNGNSVHDNVITNNRTGLILRNQTDSTTVMKNQIAGNWTVGIVFLDASSGTNVPVQTAASSTFSRNDLSGNWYGQVVDRQTGGSLPAPGSNPKNFECNWYGTTSPTTSTANSAEPGYAVQIPVVFGGTAVAPGGQPDILGPASANIDYTPWLTTSDLDGPCPYSFGGFFQPVDNPPTLNSVKAGQAIPVKFSLGGDQGLNIFYPGYPLSEKINCATTDPLDTIEATVTAGGSSLSYAASTGTYTYVWKTDKAWGGTCRQLRLKLSDGSLHTANFSFKK